MYKTHKVKITQLFTIVFLYIAHHYYTMESTIAIYCKLLLIYCTIYYIYIHSISNFWRMKYDDSHSAVNFRIYIYVYIFAYMDRNTTYRLMFSSVFLSMFYGYTASRSKKCTISKNLQQDPFDD